MVRSRKATKQVNIGPLLVRTANESADPLQAAITEPAIYCRDDLRVRVSCVRAAAAPQDLREWAFDLVSRNMRTLYEASQWGWSENAKRKELSHRDAWYLVAHMEDDNDGNGLPVGFVHFRFDMDGGMSVLYCYELQLESHVQRRGLGSHLMRQLDVLAAHFRMCKTVLTVFKSNTGALAFYQKALGYRIDETSPAGDAADYVILSRRTGVPAKR
ncbi:N-alpha-acetyltransferase 40 [Amblyomma americanum]